MPARARSLDAASEALRLHLPAWWQSRPQVDRVLAIADRASRFAAQRGENLESFDATSARAFVEAATSDGKTAPLDLRHRRRLALRLLFRAAREAGLTSADPTVDLRLPPRSQLHARPLTDDEFALCRASAAWSLSDGRRAAAFALAEATGRTIELAHATAHDLDLGSGRVWLHDGSSTRPRWGLLSDWGVAQLHRHLRPGIDRLVYGGDDPVRAGQISASIALRDVLTRAGLRSEPDVRPGSIAAWAGRQVVDETGRIDEAARRLGVSSLDRAARIIGWDWIESG